MSFTIQNLDPFPYFSSFTKKQYLSLRGEKKSNLNKLLFKFNEPEIYININSQNAKWKKRVLLIYFEVENIILLGYFPTTILLSLREKIG